MSIKGLTKGLGIQEIPGHGKSSTPITPTVPKIGFITCIKCCGPGSTYPEVEGGNTRTISFFIPRIQDIIFPSPHEVIEYFESNMCDEVVVVAYEEGYRGRGGIQHYTVKYYTVICRHQTFINTYHQGGGIIQMEAHSSTSLEIYENLI